MVRTTTVRFTQFLLNLVNLRDLFGVGIKSKKMYIQEQQQNQFHCYKQNMGFVNRMDQNMAKYRIGILMKKGGGGPRLLE